MLRNGEGEKNILRGTNRQIHKYTHTNTHTNTQTRDYIVTGECRVPSEHLRNGVNSEGEKRYLEK